MSRPLFVAEPATTYRALPPIVVDCSLLAAILFNEPSRHEALAALSGKSLHAPNLIDHEIVSVALKKVGAADRNLVPTALDAFRKLRLERHSIDPQAQFEIASSNQLTAYDAAYLQLAVTLAAPLATYDRVLADAARKIL